MPGWSQWLWQSELLGDGGLGIFLSHVNCMWDGKELAAALPFLAWTRGSNGTRGGLQRCPGGGLGANSRRNLDKRRRHECDPGLQLPFLLTVITCSQADGHLA